MEKLDVQVAVRGGKTNTRWRDVLGALTLDNRLLVIPWPLKMDRGYIFTPVCFSLCEHDISRSYGRIRTKLGGQLWCVTRTHLLDFVEDLDPDTRIFKVILHH